MKATFLFSEAMRNVATGTARAGTLMVVSFLVIAGCILLDLVAISQIDSKAQAFRDSGGATRLLVAENSVNAAACEALEDLTSVTSAGAVRYGEAVYPLAMPGVRVPHYSVTVGVAKLLSIDPLLRSGIYLPAELAQQWRISVGGQLVTDKGSFEVLGLYDYPESDGRDPRLANAILDITSFSQASECWAEAWPNGQGLDDLLRTAILPERLASAEVQIYSLNPRVRAGADAYEQFLERPSRFIAVLPVALMAIIGASSTLRRRLEHSSNLHAGASRRAVAVTTSIEAVIWVGGGAIGAVAVLSWASALLLPSDAHQLVGSYLPTIALASLSACVGAVVPFVTMSESQLFTTFKARR